MKKYDMTICGCGRIHMVPTEKIDEAIENGKNLMLICAGCGKAVLIGAYEDPDGYMMYKRDYSSYQDAFIKKEDFEENGENISEIYYSHGLRVPMKTGQYATDYFNGIFSDGWHPDFYKIQRKDVIVSEIMDFLDTYSKDRKTVNMERFIRETPDDMLEEISHYAVYGLNWKGTKWETEWNSR